MEFSKVKELIGVRSEVVLKNAQVANIWKNTEVHSFADQLGLRVTIDQGRDIVSACKNFPIDSVNVFNAKLKNGLYTQIITVKESAYLEVNGKQREKVSGSHIEYIKYADYKEYFEDVKTLTRVKF